MKEPVDLLPAMLSTPAAAVRLSRRRRAVLPCALGWTVFVSLALWWLLRANAGPSVWIMHEGGSLQPAVAQKFYAVFRADLGFQRVYAWVLFGPYVALVALYFPLERGRLHLSLPLNAAACAAFLAASQAINARTRVTGANVVIVTSQRKPEELSGSYATNRSPPDRLGASPTNLQVHLPQGFKPPLPSSPRSRLSYLSALLDLLAYSSIVGLAHSVHFYRRFREREHRALLLESNLANARLHALRAQLQPHFLFNSLNAIAALLRRDPRLAEATLLSLSELLRLSLSQSERQEVALREEIHFVQRYLEIQQTRFGDKLRLEQDLEPDALDCLVPTLLLQPLAENAIRHGLEPAENPGHVRLTARRLRGRLVLTVEDNGVGLDVPAAPSRSKGGTGIGLANLQARLEALYGSDQTLELVSRPEGGAMVRIQIPWRPVTPLGTSAVPAGS